MKELSNSKIEYLDAAFLGTMESQGFKNAKSAIKLCLFNDMSVLGSKSIDYSKWLLISSKYDGRKKIKLLQADDLAHILIKYAMASFGLNGKKFTTTESIYMDHRQNPFKSANLTKEEAIDLVSYAAFHDIYSAYVFLFSNSNVCNILVDSFINDRYMNMLIDLYDNYDGKINSDEVSVEFKYMFYKKYNELDGLFESLKEDNENYVKNS